MNSEPGTASTETAPKVAQRFEGTTNSFIVTIRSIPGRVGSRLEWRGAVEHAQSRERIYFVHLSRLNEFIAAHSGIASHPPSRLRERWRRWKKALLAWWKK